MEPLEARAKKLQSTISEAVKKLDIDQQSKVRDGFRQEINQLWASDHKKAIEISKIISDISKKIDPWIELQADLNYAKQFIELNDSTIEHDIENQLDNIGDRYAELKKELRFQGPFDDHDVILSIYAGAGGTDAQDWAQMLLRMYVRWAEAHKLKVVTVDQSSGEEAGIKSVTIEISGGTYLYGKLAGEHGVHRLVRLSPFNSAASRETSFAKVDVLPMIDKPAEVELDDKDLKIDVFRAGGHGGQSVNTTDSAVRVTHLPTGISVAIQNERSQLQNKETALTILRSRLARLQLEQHAETLADVKGPNQSAEFGSQIRNYVLHPYKQVKDNRTGYESSDVEKVLDGELDPLISAWLEAS